MPAVAFQNVSKSYRVLHQRPFLARELLRRLVQRPSRPERHEALREVSFAVEKGQSLGVVGVNGSGKSTLLALIARTSYPTSGTVTVEGRVGPLLELGAGFHPELTGYENVFLNGSLLGLTRQEITARFRSIVEYSGIAEFIAAPIRTYSTGMVARLGFAVIAHSDPDVLLVDEALAVGDAEFQAKCRETMAEFRSGGATMVVVSHDLRTVRGLCDRALWLERGSARAFGPTEEVVRAYEASLSV